MADSILRLRVNSEEYDNKLKRAAEGLTRYAEQCRKAGGTLQYVDDGVLEFTRSLGKMDTVATTTRGKLAELTKTYTELSAQYRKMTDEEKQGEYGKALAASLDQLRGRIQSSKQELDEINQSINGGGGLASSLDALAGKFGLSIKQLTGWGAALAAAKGALDVAKDAFFASESTVDEWGRVMDSSKSLYEGFLTALNTGDISGYLSRIDEIVSAARTAYNELDRLGTMKTIQAPRISAQQTENDRMRMMIQTGRYIAPVDGRRAAMADGQKLTKEQIQRIEKQLQNGMKSVVGLVSNEVKQTGRAIDAVYKRQAAELGMNIKEFRSGTSSMAEFDKRMQGYDNYQKWRASHTTIDQQSGREIVARGNPFEQFAKWGVFRVDGDRYNDLVKLIQQRDQQAAQAYSMQGQTYRTMNRAEGVTVRSIMNGGSGGGGVGTTSPVPVKIEGFDFNAAASAGVRGVDTMPSVYGMADRDAMRAAMGIAPQQWDAKQDVSKQWHIGQNGDLTQNPDDKYKEKTDKQVDVMAKLTTAIGGVSSIMSGLEQIGLDVPDEAKEVLNTIQGLMSIIQGVQAVISVFSTTSESANTAATIANTVALGVLTTAITANTATNFIPFFAKGGVVPHAANGYYVPGNSYSGDTTPILANAGELILNKSSQSTLAAQLQNSGMGSMQLEAIVRGEDLRFVINSNGRRTGRGEIVTTNFR